jgi:hypothetical protein
MQISNNVNAFFGSSILAMNFMNVWYSLEANVKLVSIFSRGSDYAHLNLRCPPDGGTRVHSIIGCIVRCIMICVVRVSQLNRCLRLRPVVAYGQAARTR